MLYFDLNSAIHFNLYHTVQVKHKYEKNEQNFNSNHL